MEREQKTADLVNTKSAKGKVIFLERVLTDFHHQLQLFEEIQRKAA